ncbi:16596_t:CDS:2, partial [Cetraspora pellucida]
MTRRRTRPETPPHICQDTRYKTLELEKTPEDRRRRKSRKLSAVKNYYTALNSLNMTTLNPIEDNEVHSPASTHSTTQAQLVQRCPRTNYNLARSSIETFKPTVVCRKHVVCGRHMLPRMSISCEHCQALHWPMESLTNCCRNGKVVLAPLGNAPESIIKLLTQNSPIMEEPYLKHIRSFNSVFAFTSMGASIDRDLADGTNGVYIYQLQGALYHRIGSLLPNEDCAPKFSQIYIYDGSFEAELRHHHNVFPFLDHDILTNIQHDLHMHNPFAQFVHGGQPIMLKLLSGQEDFIYEAQQRGESAIPENPLIVSRALAEIEDHLRQ